MPITVQGPDGAVVDFPDGTDAQTVHDAMSKKFGGSGPATGTAPVKSSFAADTIKNIPGSAMRTAKDIAQPVLHPIDTANNLYDLGKGVMQELGIASGDDYKKYPEAVGKFLSERYGSADKIAETLRTDPVGMAMDVSTILSGGGSLVARAPGVIGKAGEVAKAAGSAIDPLTAAGKVAKPVAKMAGKGAAEFIGDLGTHTGSAPLKIAAQAGYEGGDSAKAFRENMRGQAPMEDAVKDARGALSNIRKERGKEYRSGMADVSKDQTVLDFSGVDEAAKEMDKVASFKGQSLSPSTEGIRTQIKDVIQEWKGLDPKEFHTPEGFDALKKKVGDVRDATQPGTPERLVADDAYNAIRRTIIKQAPAYAHVMKAYEEASDLIREMEKTLSVNPKASVDTTLRRLQSVLRDNVNTSFGRRKELAEFLVNSGAPHLMQKLAGQSLQSWAPRGLGRATAGLEAAGALMAGSPHAAAAAVPILAASSPRIVGEVAHGVGGAARQAEKLPAKSMGQMAYQGGRANDVFENMENPSFP